MGSEVRNTSITVIKPNTGWPDVLPGTQIQAKVDLTACNPTLLAYVSVEVYTETDETLLPWTISGSSDITGNVMTTQIVNVPSDADPVECYLILRFTDNGLSQAQIIPFKVIG